MYGLLTATLSQLIWARGRKGKGGKDVTDLDSEQLIERLERLSDMRRDGWLTATEFHDAKAFILTGQISGSKRAQEIENRGPLPRNERKMRREAARAGFIQEEK